MIRKIILLTLFASMAFALHAQITLPSFFGDKMVLQQQSANKIWGKASANKTVTMRTSWDNKTYSTKSKKDGSFAFDIQTPQAGGPYTIELSDGKPFLLKDIYIGDVWLCSGQSNMKMPVKGFRGQPVFGSHPYIVGADESKPLRLFTVKNKWSKTAEEDVEGHWSLNTSKDVADFSATAYFFGKLVQEKTNIPIGLIHCSWSASKIEAWMSQETLSTIKEIDLSVLKENEFGYPNGTPTLLYNGMIKPFEGLAIKGVLWYQGEANSSDPATYKKLFPAMVKEWRQFFHSPNLPFYYVQIAPWQSGNKDELDWALFRQAQLELMSEVPNTGMAITADAGSEKFIHPPHKIKVGERLAFWALAKTYGQEGFMYSGPIYNNKYTVTESIVEVEFDYCEDGLNPEMQLVDGFEIAGEDGVFVSAKAEIIGATNRVKVWSDNIKKPTEVRYCFRNYMIGNLTNNAGLPAAPFRTIIKSLLSTKSGRLKIK